ncbi:PDZ domain-containing protein [Candidatus Magnetaquicoccus inordinatus]|uniref:PDZ domain-containing protein n=1 Tax=Candidatus Magnetaquicoccus inordinatus TaxID=2496818 RepID=UPI00102C91AA|nr:PDZ domain-containing protein [Candidatus Magnetaquicoccus inordinatus]
MNFSLVFLLILLLFLGIPSALEAGGWLGATLHTPAGVQIGDIFKDGPADHAGLRKGDLLRQIDETVIRSPDHLQEWLQQATPGKEVVLTLWRRGEELRLKLLLENSAEHLPEGGRWQGAPSDLPPPPAPPMRVSPPAANPPAPSATRATATRSSHDPQRDSPPQLAPEEAPRPTPANSWLGIASHAGTGGLTILDVAPGSPAAQAELQGGDLLIAINRQAVTSPEGLSQLLSRSRPGEWVEITYERSGRVRMTQIQLAPPPGSP